MTIYNRLEESIDVKVLIKELNTLHLSREATQLDSDSFHRGSVRKLNDASIDEIGCRSRATAIKIEALRVELDLVKTSSYLKKYIGTKYAKSFKKAGYTRVNDQKNALDVYLRKFVELGKDLDYVMKIADLVIEDVDAAGWGMKRMSETMAQVRKDR